MRPTLPSLALAAAALTAAALTASCGSQDSGLQGLIVSKSVFGADGTPGPSTLVLLRPPARAAGEGEAAETWSEEVLAVESGNLKLQLGESPDGELVYRRVQPGATPQDPPVPFGPVVRLMPRGLAWVAVEVPEMPVDGVTWNTRREAPETKDYELPGGNVFHKAFWWTPLHGEPGLLTISANMPYLQIWRKGVARWESETLWTAKVGGREQRLRDIEVGDLDGDGQDELVIVTHDRGAVFVLEQTAGGLEATEVHRTDERIFVHEVEIGDVDGDGAVEFFTTPSEPNRFDGEHQSGWIDMYRYDRTSQGYVRTVVDHLTTRHAKEILVADYDGDGKAELYAALEGEGLGEGNTASGAGAALQVYRHDPASGTVQRGETVELSGSMCRFLNVGDTNGDGQREILASTYDEGIWSATYADGAWKTERIVPGFASKSFEHATVVFDWDRDGADELFVGSDEQKRIIRVWYDREGGRYRRDTIADFQGPHYLVWNLMSLPAGR